MLCIHSHLYTHTQDMANCMPQLKTYYDTHMRGGVCVFTYWYAYV